MAGYSSDGYWVNDYWFLSFLWWLEGSAWIPPIARSNVSYIVSFENRTVDIEEETRKFVVPVGGQTG
jgi:hypothetical protein